MNSCPSSWKLPLMTFPFAPGAPSSRLTLRTFGWRSSASTAFARTPSRTSTIGPSHIAARGTNDSISSTTCFATSSEKKRGRKMSMTSSATTKVTLPSGTEILITREFDAPRDLVFKAMTDPDLIPRWWGPPNQTRTVDKMDVRPGGRWRYVMGAPDGTKSAFRGEYREVVAPERVVRTLEWEPMADDTS